MIEFDESKLTYKTLNSRSTMSRKELELINKQVKYLLKRISDGHLTKQDALSQEREKIFKGGQFSFTRFLTLKDLLSGDIE